MSRHAAASARSRRHSSRTTAPTPTTTAGTPLSAADLIARHRAATVAHTQSHADTQSHARIQSHAAARPLTAAELIARYRPSAPTSPASVRPAPRRHGAPSQRADYRLPALVRPLPIKVIARPALVAAAVIATVAGVEATHLPSSRASAEQAVYVQPSTARSASASASSPAQNSTPTTGSAPRAASVSGTPLASTSSAGATGSATSTSSASSADGTTSVTTAESMSVSAAADDRVSRGKRTATVPKILTKPGQTVAGVWVKPNTGPMTSCFCMRWGEMHWGIDLAGPLGSPILAVGDGVVVAAGPAEGFGNWVVIQHSNGDVSIYGHMRYYFVHVGQKITAGQKIALVGDEGQSTGPHLHFEIHKGGLNGVKIDPVPWLRARGISVGPYNPNG